MDNAWKKKLNIVKKNNQARLQELDAEFARQQEKDQSEPVSISGDDRHQYLGCAGRQDIWDKNTQTNDLYIRRHVDWINELASDQETVES
ncbi:MAG: hypothetical protein HQL54_01110 [Magnetococcales bacterium]|nr:hypothetical protein [Magnetococcales bacterium]